MMVFINLVWIVFMIILIFCFAKYFWKRRKLYSTAAKVPGPFAFPIVGSVHLLLGGHKVFYTNMKKMFSSYPPLFKLWVAQDLFFVTTRPQDIEIILNNSLHKSPLYRFGQDVLRNGLITAPVDIWRRHRKIINPTFNPKIIDSFHKTFVKESNNFVKSLQNSCGVTKIDLFPKLFLCALNMTFETLGDVDATRLEGCEEYISNIIRFEELLVERHSNPLYNFYLLWRMSLMHIEVRHIARKTFAFIEKILQLKRFSYSTQNQDNTIAKRFLNRLLALSQNGQLTDDEILDEMQAVLIAGSETSAITLSFVLLVLGIHPHIQENIFKELDSVFGESDRDPTLEDLNRLDYMERVIKETMRILPSIPLIGRYLDKDTALDSIVLPAGSSVFVPLVHLHKREDLWHDPMKFDPDRFLPEEVQKRHRLSYIPFSYGARNCIGFKYGMRSMRVLLSTFLRHYKVVSVDYKSIEDIEQTYTVLVKPTNGCKVVLEKRMREGTGQTPTFKKCVNNFSTMHTKQISSFEKERN